MSLARRPLLLRYAIAPLLVTLATLVQWALLGGRTPFVLILPAIMVVAWYGGLGPGLLATALGALEASYFFFEPRFSFGVSDSTELFAIAIFGVLGCSISLLCERLMQSEQARRQAEERALLETEDFLRVSRERLRAVVETAADAIITINATGIVQSVNAATERMFGYTAAEVIGQNVKILMPPPYREEHDTYLTNYANTGVKKIIDIGREVVAQRKNGSTFPVDLAVSEVEHLKLFTGILRDVTRRKELEREVVEIASLEQRRIGQDLHDSVGQELTALNMLASDLSETLRTDPSNGSKLVEQMVQGLQRSQRELRAVMRGLLPVAVDAEGLMAALSDLADRIQQEGKTICKFDCPKSVSVADNLTATHLYLIAQEAVHNAVKHAQPRNIRILLESNHLLSLSVQDDGIGMPAQPPLHSPRREDGERGLGLRIMRNRAAVIGATLTIQPAEPTGTLVTCILLSKNP
jgi:PAS domain S-box-containing protein